MTKEGWVEHVSRIPYALQDAPQEIRNDKDVVISAVSHAANALQFASDELRNDRDVVMAAVAKNGTSLEFSSEKHRNDRGVVLVALSSWSQALQFASDELRDDKDVVMAAVTAASHYGSTLQFASDELRKDRDVVLAAVSVQGDELEFASETLRNDRQVVMAAVSEYGDSLKFAHEDFQDDFEVVNAACTLGVCAGKFEKPDQLYLRQHYRSNSPLKYASERLQTTMVRLVQLVYIKGFHIQPDSEDLFRWASKTTRSDQEIVLRAVTIRPTVLRDLDRWNHDEEFMIKAIAERPEAFCFASRTLRGKIEVAEFAVKRNKALMKCALPPARAELYLRGFIDEECDGEEDQIGKQQEHE